jgi:hypothetical protein
VRLTVLRDGRNTDLSVTLQAGQQEVRLVFQVRLIAIGRFTTSMSGKGE